MPRLFRQAGPRWADGAVIYQIYPRSYQDANGDGIGDLPGITQRLDYLQELGVTGVWLSPFYPSPMADFGYDVSDYCDVDPVFGTLDDFKDLLKEAHKRDIKIIIDIVPNHSSDEHQWFKASRQSRDNKYSDWYVWKDPAGWEGTKPLPPNNWLSIFTGQSAWEWVPARQQFYLHTFGVRQPELNWQNAAVRKAMKNVLRFWLDLDVDGFRVDAVPFMGKDPDFSDNPLNPDYKEGEHSLYDSLLHINSQHWPQHYEYLQQMASVLKERRYKRQPRFMVTEGYTARQDIVEEYLRYYRGMDPKVAAPFIFEGIILPWEAQQWRHFLDRFHTALNNFSPVAVASYAFGNHDQPRLVSRLGEAQARAAAVLKLTLPGMIFVYYGEDLGMHDVDIPADKVQDPAAADRFTRDAVRTPMQWSAGVNADFSTAKETWLPLANDFKEHNVEAEKQDEASFLNLYQTLIHLRRESSAIGRGSIELADVTDPHLLAFMRKHGKDVYTIVVNFRNRSADYNFERPGHIVVSSVSGKPNHKIERHSLRLKPHEAVVIKH
ncbi:MAG TPA: alpha-amylase family glycosyl hydrolase [Candidatus Saccharimonadales bacterium]|nr:alpha-amylase family glycosyl hydrolase [Candidatus Saccharimonadales bacterium]